VAIAFARDPDMMSSLAMRFAGFRAMKAADLRGVLDFLLADRGC
jgi:hypothetical protein